MDLFSLQEAEAREGFEPGADTSAMPLAARMRPRTLDEVAGQKHLLAPGKLLRRAIATRLLHSDTEFRRRFEDWY